MSKWTKLNWMPLNVAGLSEESSKRLASCWNACLQLENPENSKIMF